MLLVLWGLRDVMQRVVMERFNDSGESFWSDGTDGRVAIERLLWRLLLV